MTKSKASPQTAPNDGSESTFVARLIADEQTSRRIADLLSESLDPSETACAAFEQSDGRWQVDAHFRNQPDETSLREIVTLAVGEELARAMTVELVAPRNWVKESLIGLRPVTAGRFVVHGAHDRAKVAINAIGIVVEAALAFGTGHHGSTSGCLAALDALAKRRRAMRIIDIGCGTGVLAIAAARCFRRSVVAGDIDTVAVAAARDNVRLNRTAAFVTVLRASGTNARTITRGKPYDLIFANILLGPLLRLAVPIRRLAAPGARIVLSGLLPSHANAVLAIYRAQGLALERRIAREGWVTLVMRRGCPPCRAR